MADTQRLRDCRQLLACFTLLLVWEAVSGQIRYSIPEEMQKGAFVGNLAKDAGLDTQKLTDGGVRILTEGRTKHFALNVQTGYLYIREKVDREEICGRISECLLPLEIFVEEQVTLYTVEIEIGDINDNAPAFQVEELELKISETTSTGSRFLLPDAQDPDIGSNSIQSFQVSRNGHFSLDVQTGADGAKFAELVLEKILDREEQAVHDLILTATDGGDPVRSGTARIRVIVEDANDNAPIFTQSVYKVNVLENVPVGSLLVTVNATDRDEGVNSEVTYSFRKISEKAANIFQLDSKTGDVTVTGDLDFEECEFYEIEVQARDGRGLSARARVSLVLVDVNDNVPEITVTSLASSIPEDSPEGTLIAFLKIRDRDSRENGEVTCSIPSGLPCRLQKLFDNYYRLVTDSALDREQVSGYNVTITAIDRGTPALSTTTFFLLKVLDKNDNPPVFNQTHYTSYIAENTPKGASIMMVKANDPDWGENARVTYSLLEGEGREAPLSSAVSINSETGAVYALRSFDYEQLRELRFRVQARDGGSPPLRSNVSVRLLVLDQNDNSPHILHPASPSDGSTGVELAPRSSEPGYLVTKVVAVDADSGQNAWLSYQLLKATEPGLFSVGVHSGEVRTARYFVDRDGLKQSLVVLVKDNGQPPLSATVTVTVAVADSIPELLSDLSSLSAPAQPQSGLTLYLVIAVASVSCVFLTFVIALVALRLRRWRESQLLDSSSGTFSGVPVSHFVGIDGVRAFLHSYSQEASLTAGSRKNQPSFPNVSCSNTFTGENPSEKPGPLLVGDLSNIDTVDQVSLQVSFLNPKFHFDGEGQVVAFDVAIPCLHSKTIILDSLIWGPCKSHSSRSRGCFGIVLYFKMWHYADSTK
ncbi:protocadherin gamma-A12-like [Pelodiscus sinensis]|uniref:protocadherin gamma-A12-like n=1 Tax=Pelodiscus sinensis TaxID=13735 RepID=UPI003F6CF402